MSKEEVLEQIYPDEVPDLLQRINIERVRQREKELTGYFYILSAPVLPWVEESFSRGLIENITGELQRIRDYLRDTKENNKKETVKPTNDDLSLEDREESYQQLEQLQQIIAKVRLTGEKPEKTG